MVIVDKLKGLVTYFTPPSLRAKEVSGDLFRTQLLIIILLSDLVVTGLALAIVLFSGSYVESTQVAIILFSAIFSGVFYSLYRLKKTGELIISANIFIFTGLVGFASAIALTGGLESTTTTHLLYILPVFAFMIAGRLWGLFWTVASCLTVVVYYILHLQGVRFNYLLSAEVELGTHVGLWMFAMALIATCLYIYELLLSKLNQEIKDKSKQYAYDSLHDPLTGLSNRRLFERRAREAIDFAISGNLKAAIIYIDLDDFKPINDLHGHHVGDEALKLISNRLLQGVRSSDTVARLGGDEFAILLHGARDIKTIDLLANKLLASVSELMVVEQHSFQLGASLGVVVIPDNCTQLDLALRLADSTMYQAKINKNRVCFYGES